MPKALAEEQERKAAEYISACADLAEQAYALAEDRPLAKFSKERILKVHKVLVELEVKTEEMTHYLNSLDCPTPPPLQFLSG